MCHADYRLWRHETGIRVEPDTWMPLFKKFISTAEIIARIASNSVECFASAQSQSPQPMSYDKYLEHIDTTMGTDTPIAFGLHPNAEIDFRTQQSETMFRVRRTCQSYAFDCGHSGGLKSISTFEEVHILGVCSPSLSMV